MQASELKYLLSLAVDTAQKAASNVIKNTVQKKKVIFELRRDIKIKADHEIEEFIIKYLSAQSSYPILSEERGLSNSDNMDTSYKWIVDPLDGSLNFSREIPMYCISIGLWKGMEPILGVVYDFNRIEIFTGIVGSGAWLNGKLVRISRVTKKSKAVLCTGFPVDTDFSNDSLIEFIENIQNFKKVRLLGSAALSLAYVSCGRADYYCEDNIKIWDVAAGLALVKAAGGVIKFYQSKDVNILKVKASNMNLL